MMHCRTNSSFLSRCLIYKYFSRRKGHTENKLKNKQIFSQLVLPPKLRFCCASKLNKNFVIVENGEN